MTLHARKWISNNRTSYQELWNSLHSKAPKQEVHRAVNKLEHLIQLVT